MGRLVPYAAVLGIFVFVSTSVVPTIAALSLAAEDAATAAALAAEAAALAAEKAAEVASVFSSLSSVTATDTHRQRKPVRRTGQVRPPTTRPEFEAEDERKGRRWERSKAPTSVAVPESLSHSVSAEDNATFEPRLYAPTPRRDRRSSGRGPPVSAAALKEIAKQQVLQVSPAQPWDKHRGQRIASVAMLRVLE